jgi:peptide chain release factor subunit 1
MAEIRKDEGGLAAYGEPQVRNALNLGAVDTLLVSEEYRSIKHKYKCPGCGVERAVAAKEDTEPLAPSCGECGAPMKPDGTEDLMEELTSMAVETGADVAVISVDSDDGSMFLKAFGGLAAILRFRGRG